MKLYKDENDNIYAYELDGSQNHLIGNKTPITQEEADAIYQANQASLPISTPLTPIEKLAAVGLTVDELKALLEAR